jgi:hypothetical protein
MAGRGAWRAICPGMRRPDLVARRGLVMSRQRASSVALMSRLAWHGVVRSLPGWSRLVLSRLGGSRLGWSRLGGSRGLRSRTWSGRIGQRRALQSGDCAGWPGWRSRPGSGREAGRGHCGRGLLPPTTRRGRVMSGTTSRPCRTSPVGVFRQRCTGRRRARDTACRLAGGGWGGTNWRSSRGKNSAMAMCEQKVRRQFEPPGGPFLAGCSRRAETGL